MSFNTRATALAIAALLALSLGGCTLPLPPDPLPPIETSLPKDELTVVADGDVSAASVNTSAALFSSSPVVVLASVGSVEQQLAAASAAISLGVPLLLVGSQTELLANELDRLGATHLVAVGDLDPDDLGEEVTGRRELVAAGTTTAALSAAIGIELSESEEPSTGSPAAQAAELSPGEAIAPPEGQTPTNAPAEQKTLQEVERGKPLGAVVVLAIDADAQVATIATARAAGARIQLVPADSVNPQVSPAAITALSDDATERVLALGSEYASVDNLEWKVASSRTGLQLPGGGQLLFPTHTIVAMYGTPGSSSLGVLGEQPLAASIERAREHASRYEGLTDSHILPAFEIITTVAAAQAGADGDYSNEIDIATLRPWVEAAGAAGLYVVLDLQPGRTDFLTQARKYEELLLMPWVGLALDPEWRLKPNERHLVGIGSVSAAEVNSVSDYLAELVRDNNLPPKLFVLHQFRLDMLENREQITVDRDEVTVLIHVDGQGSQPAKQDTWAWLRRDAPHVAWGWKNFYDEDLPVLTAEQTIQQVSPLPELITYQ